MKTKIQEGTLFWESILLKRKVVIHSLLLSKTGSLLSRCSFFAAYGRMFYGVPLLFVFDSLSFLVGISLTVLTILKLRS